MKRRLSAGLARSLVRSVTPFCSALRGVTTHRCRVVAAGQRRRAVAVAAAAVAALALAGCAGGTSIGSGSSNAKESGHAGVVAWTDATRLPGFQLYAKEHPGAKLSIQSYNGDSNGSNYLQTKVELDNQVGKGWPDLVFSEVPNDVIWAAQPQYHYAAVLNDGLVPQSVINGYPQGALAGCYVGGKLYCLKNDLAQDVLWVNTTLMKRFGYPVPTTWEQFTQLGLRLAREHPGYVMGAAADPWVPEEYYWASGCPTSQAIGTTAVRINISDPKCTRVTSMLDILAQAGAFARMAIAGNSFTQKYGAPDKVLMAVGPAWEGQTLFQEAWNVPHGQIAAYPPLRWADEPTAWTGDVGGGIYMVSSHASDPKAAAAVAVWMATSNDYQGHAPGYPAYAPAAKAWMASQPAGFYATPPGPVLQQAAQEIRPGFNYLLYSQEAVFAQAVVPGISQGKPIASLSQAWQTAMEDQARSDGYSIQH